MSKWRQDVAMSSMFAGGGWVPLLLGMTPLGGALMTLGLCVPRELWGDVGRSCVLAVVTYFGTRYAMPVIAAKMPLQKRGCDLLKRPPREKITDNDKDVPEALGIVSGVAFIIALVLTQATHHADPRYAHEYAAAMLCIVFAVLLGFVDDFLALEWKYKYFLPPLMTLPLLSAYDGGTRIVPPRFCRAQLLDDDDDSMSRLGQVLHTVLSFVFGGSVDEVSGAVDLGLLYRVYMVALGVFCTNAINIYAGVNGLEAGQIYVIACAILTMSAIELGRRPPSAAFTTSGPLDDVDDAYSATKNHLFSVTLMLPFAATSLALLRSNWFPARVFVGDTFTNYAGMTLAVVAILGHFPIMLMLLMLPQLVNFLLSVPQLFGLRPCPRHRLPTYDETTGLVQASRVNDRRDIVGVKDGRKINLTLINATLALFGPMTEPLLTTLLLVLQLLCCAAGLALRFALAGHIY